MYTFVDSVIARGNWTVEGGGGGGGAWPQPSVLKHMQLADLIYMYMWSQFYVNYTPTSIRPTPKEIIAGMY